MKRTRFSETPIIPILKQAEAGITVKDLCREHGLSDATYYAWKAKYGGLEASALKWLKETESERAKLKRMDADLAFENRALKDLIEKQLARRRRNGRPCHPSTQPMAFPLSGAVRP
ncbi:MAG: transposase [Nitrospirae bacterium]|nr:MAG: transposase [Nitrospirota bacterium]